MTRGAPGVTVSMGTARGTPRGPLPGLDGCLPPARVPASFRVEHKAHQRTRKKRADLQLTSVLSKLNCNSYSEQRLVRGLFSRMEYFIINIDHKGYTQQK